MRREDFHYQLPEELIARRPTEERRGSRLLHLDGPSGEVAHRQFSDLLQLVEAGDLMVFNDTRVIPARVFGKKETGGQVEILVERVLDQQRVMAHIRSSKSPKVDSIIVLEDGTQVVMAARHGALFELHFSTDTSAINVLETIGHMPLPPYIERPDDDADKERYQTVYGQKAGAVAAPTAGLHFDDDMLQQLRAKGVNIVFVTLHVGAGTFQPVRVDDIHEHTMHSEVMEVSAEVCEAVKATKAAGKRVIAVGTTSVRCLETAAQCSGDNGEQNGPLSDLIAPYQGETEIFIYPSYQYKVVDALITNFHLPESTLLMLVSAFAGYSNTMLAYRAAVSAHYRFFSYGDCMFITHNPSAQAEVVDITQLPETP